MFRTHILFNDTQLSVIFSSRTYYYIKDFFIKSTFVDLVATTIWNICSCNLTVRRVSANKPNPLWNYYCTYNYKDKHFAQLADVYVTISDCDCCVSRWAVYVLLQCIVVWTVICWGYVTGLVFCCLPCIWLLLSLWSVDKNISYTIYFHEK